MNPAAVHSFAGSRTRPLVITKRSVRMFEMFASGSAFNTIRSARLPISIVPVSLRGRVYGLAQLGLTRTKRRIKRDPRLYAAAARLRKLTRRS